MITPNRERRDWTLLIFIIPIGIILMLIAGQIAVYLVPEWSVNAGMQSNLDLDNLPRQQSGLVPPVLPAILTPLGWLDTFLTPGAGSGDQVLFPPFVVLEPSATPKATLPPPSVETDTPVAPTTATPAAPSSSPPPATPTKNPANPPTSPPDVVAPPPVVNPPPVDPPAVDPPPVDPPPVDPPPVDPPPVDPGTTSTVPSGYISVPPPSGLEVNNPPDGKTGDFPSLGSYTYVDLGTRYLKVSIAPDGNYDLIIYEKEYAVEKKVYLDQMSVGIAKTMNGSYYEVFNWGDNKRDTNTNVDTNDLSPDTSLSCLEPECDNRAIPSSELYSAPATDPVISSGILIDVDNASSKPPPGDYQYIVIISPPSLLDAVQVDAVVVDEVPIPP